VSDHDGDNGHGDESPSEGGHVFADGKDPDAFRTIGEVASGLNIRQHVMRYWEEQFPMLRPVKRSGGRRYYRPEDVRLVETIDRLVHREGYTLRGARQAIEAQTKGRSARGGAAGAPVALPRAAETPVNAPLAEYPKVSADDVVGQLRVIRDTLAAALEA
jgi:DNA-binding transcriptional MerR regulator